MVPEGVYVYLTGAKILDDDDKRRFNAATDTYEKNHTLLTIVAKHGTKGFEAFLEALKTTGQDGLASTLEATLQDQYSNITKPNQDTPDTTPDRGRAGELDEAGESMLDRVQQLSAENAEKERELRNAKYMVRGLEAEIQDLKKVVVELQEIFPNRTRDALLKAASDPSLYYGIVTEELLLQRCIEHLLDGEAERVLHSLVMELLREKSERESLKKIAAMEGIVQIRQHMTEDFGPQKLNERLMFHGTHTQVFDNIYPKQRPYSSTCDNPNKPTIIVVYDSAQAYPEYVVAYT
nr:hypothetical protein BaRGS_034536 [Batillaria attramentaria]